MAARAFGCTVLAALALAGTGCSDQAKIRRNLSNGAKFYEAGSIDAARVEFMRVIRLEPDHPEALAGLARVWYDHGVPIRTHVFLEEAVKANPGDADLVTKLARVNLSLERVSEARENALAALRADPTNDDAVLVLAGASRSPEEIAEARVMLERFGPGSATPHLGQAVLAAVEGDDAARNEALAAAEAAAPDSERVQTALAGYYEATGDTRRMIGALAKASELAPRRSTVHIRYAMALQEAGAPDRARELVTAVVGEVPDYVPAWIYLAELALADGDLDQAESHLAQAILRDANNPAAMEVRSKIFAARGDPARALAVLREMHSILPFSPRIKSRLAESLIDSGLLDEARDLLATAVEATPDSKEIVMQLARLDIRQGRAWAAAQALEKLSEHLPGDRDTDLLLARAYQAEGRYAQAAAVFERRIAAGDRSVASHVMLALIARRQGDLDKAVASLLAADKISPGHPVVAHQLIEIDIARGSLDSALRRAEAVREQAPDEQAGHYLVGTALSAAGRWDEAEQALLKAIELRPEAPSPYEALVSNYVAAGKLEEAIRGVESALEANPGNLRHLMLGGKLFWKAGDRAKAIGVYEELHAQQPEATVILNNLAYLLADEPGALERAAGLAARARELSPEQPDIADTLGWISFRLKEYPQALALIEEASVQFHDVPEVSLHLGLARLAMGLEESGIAALREAAAGDHAFAEAASRHLATATETEVDRAAARVAEEPDGYRIPHLRLARLLEASGEAERAGSTYREALDGHPKLCAAHLGLARLYAGPLDDLAVAEDAAQRALDLAIGNPEAAWLRGHVALRQGEFGQAYSHLSNMASLAGDRALPHWALDRARASLAIGKRQAAHDMLGALAGRPADQTQSTGTESGTGTGTPAADPALVRALTTITAPPGEPPLDELGQACDTLLSRNPRDPIGLAGTAEIALRDGDASSAAEILENLLVQHPQFVPAQVALAGIYVGDRRELESAVRLAASARELVPDDPAVARTLGVARLWTGKPALAIPLLEEAARGGALDPDAEFALGVAYSQSDQPEPAVSRLTNALARGLGEPMASEAEVVLEKLRESAQ